jgi:hypothetical protein
MACVYAATRTRGVQASACAHNSALTATELGSPSIPNTRASTRLALPSRIEWGSPRDSAKIAPAVERPIPGKPITASRLAGNSPPCSATNACAHALRFRARA